MRPHPCALKQGRSGSIAEREGSRERNHSALKSLEPLPCQTGPVVITMALCLSSSCHVPIGTVNLTPKTSMASGYTQGLQLQAHLCLDPARFLCLCRVGQITKPL